jgi:hypothetical protein
MSFAGQGSLNIRRKARVASTQSHKEKKLMTTQAISHQNFLEAQSMHATQLAISNKRLWSSRIMGGLAALFLLMDGGMKLFKPVVVVEATKQLGYPESTIVGIGLVLLASTVLYLVPRTAILGAVLLTGYLGGAVATQVRVAADLFNIIFPVFFCALLWGAVWLRDRRLQELLPLRTL